MKLELSRQIFEKYANIKFHENPSNDIRVIPCGLTDRGQKDMKKLIVVFRNFAKSSKKHKTNNSLQDFFPVSVDACRISTFRSHVMFQSLNHLNEFFNYNSAHESKNPTLPRNFVIRLSVDEASYLRGTELSAMLLCKQ